MMPTCLAPSSVQQNNHDLLPGEASWALLQPVESLGVAAEYLFHLMRPQTCAENGAQGVYDLPVLGGHSAHRPVAPEHQPIDPKYVDDMVHIGCQGVRRPAGMIRLGHHPGEFAIYIGEVRDAPDERGPGLDLTRGDGRFG